jgi:type I restriction enzyme S subunit
MPNDWHEVVLSSIADLSGGFAFKSEDYASSGRFILRTLNIRDDCSISRDDAVYLQEELCPQYARFELKPNDTLFVMVGATLGKIGYVRQKDLPALLNQNMWLIRAKQGIADPRFLHYAFRHAVKESLGWASGSARDFVRRDDYRGMQILVPPLSEQRAIAHMLGTLDDKIELNRRMNETLEAMARAVFKSWFVDFDLVHAKAEGRQPLGMDAKTAALFPNSFEDSSLGKIPKGWKVGRLGEIAENPRRGVHPGGVPEDTPYIGLEHMPRKSIALASSGHSGDVASNKFAFRQEEILFGKLRPYFHKVGVATLDGVCSTDILVIIAKSQEWYGIVLGHVSSEDFVAYTDAVSTGTKMPRTNWQDMARYEIPLPDPRLADTFSPFTKTVVQSIRENILQSQTLATMRDALLPKLISGEVRVNDAEKIVGASK